MFEENQYPKMVTVDFEPDTVRALIKSVSIGCDQLLSKLERMDDSRARERVVNEYAHLLGARNRLEIVYAQTFAEHIDG